MSPGPDMIEDRAPEGSGELHVEVMAGKETGFAPFGAMGIFGKLAYDAGVEGIAICTTKTVSGENTP